MSSIIVLYSFCAPGREANPYVTQLLRSLDGSVRHRYFSYVFAMTGRFDVFHVHWPEYLMRHRTKSATLLKQCAFALLLVRLWLTRTPIVQTIHNPSPHEKGMGFEARLLRRLDSLTSHWIRLNESTPTRAPATTTIPIGHYSNWYKKNDAIQPIFGRLLFFGLIRQYKGVEELLEAFAAVSQERALSLRLVGRSFDGSVSRLIEWHCERDLRISANLSFLPDDEFVDEIMSAELVVLPYRRLHNSAAVLTALSFARPVLVPENDVTRALSAEVGAGWVTTFSGRLTPEAIVAAAAQARNSRGAPDLTGRAWDGIANKHVQVFRSVINRQIKDATR